MSLVHDIVLFKNLNIALVYLHLPHSVLQKNMKFIATD